MPRLVKHVADITSIDEAQRTFLDWIFDFEAVDDAATLLSMLAQCDERLPTEYCDLIGLSDGSTFAEAATLLGSPWGLA